MSFKNFYYDEDETDKVTKVTPEQKFEEAVGCPCPSLNSFCSWLILNKHLKGVIKLRENHKKPVSILDLSPDKKILCLVKMLPNIKKLAEEFHKIFGNFKG